MSAVKLWPLSHIWLPQSFPDDFFVYFFFLFSRINLWVFLCTTPFTPPTVYLFFSRLPTLSISIGPPPSPLCLSWVKSTYLTSPLATVSTTKPCLLSPLHSSLSSLSSKLFASQYLLVKLLSMQPSDTARYVVITRRWRRIKKTSPSSSPVFAVTVFTINIALYSPLQSIDSCGFICVLCDEMTCNYWVFKR